MMEAHLLHEDTAGAFNNHRTPGFLDRLLVYAAELQCRTLGVFSQRRIALCCRSIDDLEWVRQWRTWCVTQEVATHMSTFDLELVEVLSSPISSAPQPTTCTTSVWEVHCVRASVGVIGMEATWRDRVMRCCCVFV